MKQEQRDYVWSLLPDESQQNLKEKEIMRPRQSSKYCIPCMIVNRNLRCLLLAITLILLYVMFRYLPILEQTHYLRPSVSFVKSTAKSEELQPQLSPRAEIDDTMGNNLPYDIAVPALSPAWYDKRCFTRAERKLGESIADIYEKLELMKGSDIPQCLAIWTIFDRMFSLEVIDAPIVLPDRFQEEVKGWLGNDPLLFQLVNHQKVYQIINKASFEETVFNPLRSKRPTSNKLSIDPAEYIANLTLSTEPDCDFCKYKDHTAADTFGRIENEYSASASNTFKLAKFHGLFFPKTHHPLNISIKVLGDLFINTSLQWFEKAHATDVTQRYPSLLWDALPHAGASQVHPHVHGILGVRQYTGSFENLHSIAQKYFKKYKQSYWTDLIQVHWALGLGITLGKAIAIVPLFPRKDHEYMIFSSDVDENFVGLIYSILEGYKNRLGVYCFSAGGALPFMGVPTSELDRYTRPGLPVMFRFGSRGVCTSITSDVSSLDLYTVNNINSDLSVTFKALKESTVKRKLVTQIP